MRELSVAEQRYEAVRAVIADGATVTDVAARFGVSRKTVTPPGLFSRETSLELLEHRTAAKAARDLQGDPERARVQARRDQLNEYTNRLRETMTRLAATKCPHPSCMPGMCAYAAEPVDTVWPRGRPCRSLARPDAPPWHLRLSHLGQS
jgi:transposase-like protein